MEIEKLIAEEYRKFKKKTGLYPPPELTYLIYNDMKYINSFPDYKLERLKLPRKLKKKRKKQGIIDYKITYKAKLEKLDFTVEL